MEVIKIEVLKRIFSSEIFHWLPAYSIRQSMRARRMQLKILPMRGLEIILPERFQENKVRDFVLSQQAWIEKHAALISINPMSEQITLDLPEYINLPALNEIWQMRYIQTIEKHKIDLLINPQFFLTLVGDIENNKNCYYLLLKWLKKKANDYFNGLLKQLSAETSLSYCGYRVRIQKTLWGSCTAHNIINLNAALLFLSPQLVRYVLIHELCHTIHRNHLKRFWSLVKKFDPNFKEHAYLVRRAMKYVPDWVIKFNSKEFEF